MRDIRVASTAEAALGHRRRAVRLDRASIRPLRAAPRRAGLRADAMPRARAPRGAPRVRGRRRARELLPLRRRARRARRRRRARPREGAFSFTLVPIRPRRRGERRFLRTFAVVSLRPGSLAFNPQPQRLSTPLLTPMNSTPTFAWYGTTSPTSRSRSCPSLSGAPRSFSSAARRGRRRRRRCCFGQATRWCSPGRAGGGTTACRGYSRARRGRVTAQGWKFWARRGRCRIRRAGRRSRSWRGGRRRRA